MTANPDAQLDALIREYQTGQTTLANKSIDLGEGHPTIKSLKAAMESLNQQIDNRIKGILAGLELRVNSSLAQVRELQKSVDDAKAKEAKVQEEGREYFDAKRKLSNTTRMRDTILFRIMQEEVDLGRHPVTGGATKRAFKYLPWRDRGIGSWRGPGLLHRVPRHECEDH